jgi:hypothetical protein
MLKGKLKAIKGFEINKTITMMNCIEMKGKQL